MRKRATLLIESKREKCDIVGKNNNKIVIILRQKEEFPTVYSDTRSMEETPFALRIDVWGGPRRVSF